MLSNDIISVQETKLPIFVAEHWRRWAADELNYRSFLRLNTNSCDQVVCLTMRDANHAPLGFACVFLGDQILLSAAPMHGVVELAKYLVQHEIEIPGIFAPRDVGYYLGECLSGAGRKPYRCLKSILHWELVELLPFLPVEGQLRPASEPDIKTLVGMHHAMQEELNTQRPYDPHQMVRTGIARGELFVWDAPGQPVVSTSLSSLLADLDTYGAIDGVFTKPEFRGRGYAGSLIWHLARDLLGQRRAIFLSSDAEENASFRVYEKLGFKVKSTMVNLRAQV